MAIPPFSAGGYYQQPQANPMVLALGTAGNPVGTVYTVPLRTKAEITSIHAHNYDSGAQTLDFYVRLDSGTAYLFHRMSLAANTSSSADVTLAGMRILLGPSYQIRLLASKAASIDYLITGYEHFLPTGGRTT